MKRIFYLGQYYLGMLCLVAIMATSCSDDNEPSPNIDNSPIQVDFQIIITDADGNNRLNADNITETKNNVTINYSGKTYRFDDINTSEHRCKCIELSSGEYLLWFGYFIGDYENETFVIDYGNGNFDIISFMVTDYAIVGKTQYSISLNGELQSNVCGPNFVLTLKK